MSAAVFGLFFRHNRDWWLIPFFDGLVFIAVGSVMVLTGGNASQDIAIGVVVGGMLALASGIMGAFSRAPSEQQSS